MLVDKPAGMTSHDVVQHVRRKLGSRAAGHTGTLDPFATGLLVVLVGRATRLARFVQGFSSTTTWAGALSWLTVETPRSRRGELLGTAFGAAVHPNQHG